MLIDYGKNGIENFILWSGDSDFADPVRQLLSDGKKVVLFAGKLTKYKGVEYLVKAARKIHGEILILGDGKEKRNLMNIAKDLKINNVRFLGHIGKNTRKLVQLYSRANVFVAPSVWDEPLGLVILESKKEKMVFL